MRSKIEIKPKDFWQDHVTKQGASDLSAAEYCRANNLLTSSFYKWRIHFSSKSKEALQPFARVEVTPNPESGLRPAARAVRVRVTEFELSGGVYELRAFFGMGLPSC